MKRDGCDLHIQAKGGEPVCSEAMEQRTDWSELCFGKSALAFVWRKTEAGTPVRKLLD